MSVSLVARCLFDVSRGSGKIVLLGACLDPHCHPLQVGGQHIWIGHLAWPNVCWFYGQESSRIGTGRETTRPDGSSASGLFGNTLGSSGHSGSQLCV